MSVYPYLTKIVAPLPVAALLSLPATASAVEFGGRVEPGIAVPLAAPQTQRFDPGGVVSLKGYLGLARFFDVQAGVGVLGLWAEQGRASSTAGTAWSQGLGFRLKRPHDISPGRGALAAASPWVDADALYVRTGGLDRFGLTTGVGVSFPLTEARQAWLGPFVRYMHIFQPAREGFNNSDAKVLFVGLNFEFGSSPLASRAQAPPPAAECPACAPVAAAASLVDRDQDGVADAMDYCPSVAGPVENRGCPVYKKVIVKPDKLELTEKILFSFDRADIEAESFPLLDDVVQALKDNKDFRVQIEGHTDATGSDKHNQGLSEQRAEAVLDYLRSHGIAPGRLSSKGFGSTMPTASNKTSAGRENNRRVDFVVQFKIIDRSAP